MAILPGAIVKIVARHDTPRTWERGTCLHIAVSDGLSLFNYFNQAGNPTSHGYVRKTGSTPAVAVGTPLCPVMADFEQYVDTIYRAPAQLEGNPTLISWETQGGVGADLDAGWTPAQCERLAWLLAQCNKIHGTPLEAMPNSLPKSTGTGYHRLGVDPWRVDGGEHWSTSYGKVCPGSARMAQIPSIISRARQLVAPPSAEDIIDMATQAEVAQAVEAGIGAYMSRFFKDEQGTGDTIWDESRANHAALMAKLDSLIAAVEALTVAVTPPSV